MRTLVGVAVLLATSVAHAGDAQDQRTGRLLYEQGLRDFEAGHYDKAIEAFDAAMDIAPSPALHYNIAQAYRLKGDCARALPAYRAYLREDPKAPNRQKVLVRIAEMQRCQHRAAPEPGEARHSGWSSPDDSEGDDVGDGEGTSDDPMAPTPGEGEKDTPYSRRTLRLAGWITAGVGVGLVAGGYAVGRRAASREAQIDRLFQNGGMWSSEYENLENDGRNAAKVSAVCYVAGAAAILTGGVLVWLGAQETERVQVGPMGKRGVSVAWKF